MTDYVPDEPGLTNSPDVPETETPHGLYVIRGLVDPVTMRGLRAALDRDLDGDLGDDMAGERAGDAVTVDGNSPEHDEPSGRA